MDHFAWWLYASTYIGKTNPLRSVFRSSHIVLEQKIFILEL